MLKNLFVFTALFIACSSINSYSQNLVIDHVIIVVENLGASVEEYESYGFTIKKGRLHDNGLENAHIKFINNSSLELMTISGTPKDEISKNYRQLLEVGEGGVFLALSGIKFNSLREKLNELKIKYNTINGSSWNYITFNPSTGLEHIFFIKYLSETMDPKELYSHANKANGFKSIEIEGGTTLVALLKGLGLTQIDQENKKSTGFSTPTGQINIVQTTPSGSRPRINSISFNKNDGSETLELTY